MGLAIYPHTHRPEQRHGQWYRVAVYADQDDVTTQDLDQLGIRYEKRPTKDLPELYGGPSIERGPTVVVEPLCSADGRTYFWTGHRPDLIHDLAAAITDRHRALWRRDRQCLSKYQAVRGEREGETNE